MLWKLANHSHKVIDRLFWGAWGEGGGGGVQDEQRAVHRDDASRDSRLRGPGFRRGPSPREPLPDGVRRAHVLLGLPAVRLSDSGDALLFVMISDER